MAKYVADMKCIASIYPGQLQDQRRSYGPSRESSGPKAQRSTLFHLDPVPRGSKPPYCVIEVYDSFEDVLDVMNQSGSQGGNTGPRPRIQKPVPVDTIIADLLTAWTGGLYNVPPGAKPGVIEIIGSVPTQAERRQMEEQQAAYFEYWFGQGEALYRGDPTTIQNYKTYTTEMRLAAEWLGRQRPWSDVSLAAQLVACKWCTSLVPEQAIFCPQCQKQLQAVPPEMMALLNGGQQVPAAVKVG